MVKEADVQIYGIGLFDSTPRTPEERNGSVMLSRNHGCDGRPDLYHR